MFPISINALYIKTHLYSILITIFPLKFRIPSNYFNRIKHFILLYLSNLLDIIAALVNNHSILGYLIEILKTI